MTVTLCLATWQPGSVRTLCSPLVCGKLCQSDANLTHNFCPVIWSTEKFKPWYCSHWNYRGCLLWSSRYEENCWVTSRRQFSSKNGPERNPTKSNVLKRNPLCSVHLELRIEHLSIVPSEIMYRVVYCVQQDMKKKGAVSIQSWGLSTWGSRRSPYLPLPTTRLH